MNSLSWFLYIVHVIGSLRFFMTVAIPAIAVGTVVVLVVHAIRIDCVAYSNNREEEKAALRIIRDRHFLYGIKTTLAVWLICPLVLILTPGKDTLYAIAASQVGERVVQSEAVQGIANDATRALQQWIKRQIEPDSK